MRDETTASYGGMLVRVWTTYSAECRSSPVKQVASDEPLPSGVPTAELCGCSIKTLQKPDEMLLGGARIHDCRSQHANSVEYRRGYPSVSRTIVRLPQVEVELIEGGAGLLSLAEVPEAEDVRLGF